MEPKKIGTLIYCINNPAEIWRVTTDVFASPYMDEVCQRQNVILAHSNFSPNSTQPLSDESYFFIDEKYSSTILELTEEEYMLRLLVS